MKIINLKLNRKFALEKFENFDIILEAEISEIDDVDRCFEMLNSKIIGMSTKIKHK